MDDTTDDLLAAIAGAQEARYERVMREGGMRATHVYTHLPIQTITYMTVYTHPSTSQVASLSMALEEHGSRMITIRTPAPLEYQHMLFDAMESKNPRHYSSIAAASDTPPLLRNELPGGAELRWVVFPATESFHIQVRM